MIPIAVCVIAGIAMLYRYASRESLPSPFKVSVFAGSIIGGIVGVFVALAIGYLAPKEKYQIETIVLESLCGRGSQQHYVHSVGRSQTYHIFASAERQGKWNEVRGSSVERIVEEERSDGILQVYREGFKSALWWFLAVHIPEADTHEFYIPHGTVTQAGISYPE